MAADASAREAAPLAAADVAFALTEWAGLACGLRLVLIGRVHASEQAEDQEEGEEFDHGL